MTKKALFCPEELLTGKLLTLNLDTFSLEISPEGRGLFFNSRTGEILSLNQAAAFIVESLRVPTSLNDLAEAFSRRFVLTNKAAKTDLLEFLSILDEMMLLRIL